MIVAQHWHAFAWVGHERPADNLRTDPNQPCPPLEISHWLRKPAKHVVQTFANPGELDAALAWMRERSEQQPHLSEEAFPVVERMPYWRDNLQRGADSIRGYYSKNQRYVSIALVACPREGACPYGS